MTHPRLLRVLSLALFPAGLVAGECAENLTETCQKLEQQASAETFQEAVNDCHEVIKGKCGHLLNEEDPLTLERFYHSYADSLQRLAAKMEDPKYKAELDARALDRWEQYFEWLRNLPQEERDKLVTSPKTRHGKKMFAAAAAIGISALAAEKPQNAYAEYEELEAEYFGSDALNWWLAALFHPDQPGIIDDTIFRKIARNPRAIAARCKDAGWKEHWDAFVQKVMVLTASKRCSTARERYVRRIDSIVRASVEKIGAPSGPLL